MTERQPIFRVRCVEDGHEATVYAGSPLCDANGVGLRGKPVGATTRFMGFNYIKITEDSPDD